GLHALGGERDPVGDGDGVDLDGSAAGLTHSFLHELRELAVVEVAGHDLDPGVRHADERLAEVVVAVADRPHHRPRRRTRGAVDHDAAVTADVGPGAASIAVARAGAS